MPLLFLLVLGSQATASTSVLDRLQREVRLKRLEVLLWPPSVLIVSGRAAVAESIAAVGYNAVIYSLLGCSVLALRRRRWWGWLLLAMNVMHLGMFYWVLL